MNNQDFTIEELLDREGFAVHDVKGVSMYPLLDAKTDRVLLVKADYDKINLGDIVLYKNHGEYVLHRIVDIEHHCELDSHVASARDDSHAANNSGTKYKMRGDNCGFADAYITKNEIIAQLKAYWRGEIYSEDLSIKRTHPLFILKLRDILRKLYAK